MCAVYPSNSRPTDLDSESQTRGAWRRRLVVVGVALSLPALLWPWIVQLPPGGIEDDGYFYSQIAYNAGVHGRVSFDGIHPTDGFHLLWGYLLAAVSWLTALASDSKTVHLYLHCAVTVAVLGICGDRFGRSWTDRALLVALGMTGALPFETPLLALFYLCFMTAASSRGFEGRSWPLVLFPLLMVLTRIDAAPMAIVGAGVLLVHRRPRDFGRVVIGLVCGIVLQLVLMKALGGEWFSVSSTLKASRVGPLELPGVPPYLGRFVVLLVLGGVSGAAVVRHARWTRDVGPLFLWLGAVAFTASHFVFSLLRPWYYVPAFLVMVVALLWTQASETARTRWRVAHALAVVGAAAIAFVAIEAANSVRYRGESRRVRDFIEEVRRLVPATEPIYQVDGAGYTGFFTERRVVNGDGLVNTHEYARRLLANDLAGYLDEEGISYIITNRRRRSPVVEIGGLVVETSEVEELARKPGDSVNRFTNFVLYRRLR